MKSKAKFNKPLANPAEMKSYLEDLPVNKVYVVLAGTFSNNARTRLKNEISEKINIYDIEFFDVNWLIEKFTAFHPSIFFQGNSITFLENKINELEENHHRSKSGKNLSDYFVNPLIQPFGAALEFDEEKLHAYLKEGRFRFPKLLDISKQRKDLFCQVTQAQVRPGQWLN